MRESRHAQTEWRCRAGKVFERMAERESASWDALANGHVMLCAQRRVCAQRGWVV